MSSLICYWETGGWLNKACSGCNLVDYRSIPGQRNRFAFSANSFKPCCFGDLNLPESLFRGVTEGRTKLQVRDICNISFVLFAIEDIDVVVFHFIPPYNLEFLASIIPHDRGGVHLQFLEINRPDASSYAGLTKFRM